MEIKADIGKLLNKMPKLSIITVNLNNAVGLEKTIRSVISQTFSDYEYIIIDGGSTDGSVEVIKKYADKITYWVSEPDKGIYNAMNKGIKVAKGEWLYFLNSGDRLYDDSVLEKIFSSNIEKYDFVYGNVKRIPSNNVYAGEFTYEKLLNQNIAHQSVFQKKKLFKEIGKYDEKYKIAADYAFNIRAFEKLYSHVYLPIIIAEYDENGLSSTNFDDIFFYDIKKNFIRPFNKKVKKEKIIRRLWLIFDLFIKSDTIFIKKIIFLLQLSIYSKSIGGFYLGFKKIIKG